MKKLLTSIVFFITLFLGFIGGKLNAQNTQSVNDKGVFLTKSVLSSSIQTGANFTYNIQYSIPAGSTGVVITDQLPASLELVYVAAGSPCGTASTTVSASGSSVANSGVAPNFTPPAGTIGALVTYSIPSVTTACMGSFQIIVRFPAGTTCNGATADNIACIGAKTPNGSVDMCTKAVRTTAIAANPWSVAMNPISTFYTGQSPCGNLTTSDTVTYQIKVGKNSGFYGQLNLMNAVVTQTLPANATLISATATIGTITPGALPSTAPTIVWSLGNLSVTSPPLAPTLTIKVVYAPSLAAGTVVSSTATLSGLLGVNCNLPLSTTAGTCVIKGALPPPTGAFGKWVYVTGNSVGCTGYYHIRVRNNGSVPLGSFSWNDPMPTGITVTSVQLVNPTAAAPVTLRINSSNVIVGATSVQTYSTLPITNVGITQTGSLTPGQFTLVRVNFTINSSAPSVVTNTATMVTPTTVTPTVASVPFGVYAPAPVACAFKSICSPKAGYIYNPGDIIRYRLRVQNRGTATMSSAMITDVLDANMTYIGNPTYYISLSNNPPCGTVSTPTWAPTPAHTGNTLIWNLPNITSNCQSILWPGCPDWGITGLDFYYIEFDAQVKSNSGLGTIINKFTVSGGNLTSSAASNNTYISVVGTAGLQVDKQVSTDNGTTYATSATTTAGASVNYRLRVKNTGTVGLTNPIMIDLLPLDNGVSDNLIMARPTLRGSQFDVTFGSAITLSPTPQFSAGTNLCLPEFNYSPTTPLCTAPAWVLPLSPSNNKNVKIDYGSATTIATSGNLIYDFKAQISSGAKVGDKACNSFASNAAYTLIMNGVNTPTGPSYSGAPESNTVCVSITQPCALQVGISGNTNLCKGTSTTLTASGAPCTGALSYLWSTGAVTSTLTVTPLVTTTYTCTVTCTTPTGVCKGTKSVTVYVLPSAFINLISQCIKCNGPTAIVSLDIEVYNGTAPYTYLWSNGAITQDLVNVTGTANSYCVTVTDAKGCKTIKCFDCMNPCGANQGLINNGSAKAVKENGNENIEISHEAITDFKVYPNPFDNDINVEWAAQKGATTENEKMTINIYNATGQLVKSQIVYDRDLSSKIQTNGLPFGLYNVVIESAGKVLSATKIIKD